MNDMFNTPSFGTLTVDSLPAGYGETPTKVVAPVGTQQETDSPPSADTNYGNFLDRFRRDKDQASTAEQAPAPSTTPTETGSPDRERNAFFANLGSGLSDIFQPAGKGQYCIRKGKDEYTYHQYTDGKVYVAGPPGLRYTGTTWSATHPGAKQVKAWYGPCTQALTGRTTRGTRQERAATAGTGIGAAAAQLLPALASILGPQTVTEYDEEFVDVGTSESGKRFPWGYVIGGVSVLGIIGIGVVLIRSGDDE
jgi:hypothetical protein